MELTKEVFLEYLFDLYMDKDSFNKALCPFYPFTDRIIHFNISDECNKCSEIMHWKNSCISVIDRTFRDRVRKILKENRYVD